MNKPKGNGLVELVDDREPKESSFFCMDLVGFITQEIGERGVTCAGTIFIDGTDSWELWHGRFEQAKNGRCAYRNSCRRWARTKND